MVFWVMWEGRSDVVAIGDFLSLSEAVFSVLPQTSISLLLRSIHTELPSLPGIWGSLNVGAWLLLVRTAVALRARRAKFTTFGVLLVVGTEYCSF